MKLICAATLMINLSGFEWNDHDDKIKKVAEARCPQLYVNSPCLSKFIKTGKQDYRVLCGKEKSNELY